MTNPQNKDAQKMRSGSAQERSQAASKLSQKGGQSRQGQSSSTNR